MTPRSVDVLGGGPAGLFVARLLRRRFPDVEVVVHEQTDAGGTFGFGVGLTAGTQRNIASADPEVYESLRAASNLGSGSMMKAPTGVVSMSTDGVVGIGRLRLVQELSRLAVDAGAEIRYGHRRSLSDLSADLVIAADGVNSCVRHGLGDQFGATVDEGRGLYLWCGADFALEVATFEPVTTQHGTFTLHAYPYAEDKSTFLVETDEQTWRNAGFDAATDRTAADESDQASLDHLTRVFADTLGGRRLVGSRTRWSRFRTVSCQRWFHDNVVLVGDAAHTTHYSVGSGTKLAMEDAIALADAIGRTDGVADALQAYDRSRRPEVESLQRAARRSQAWWDSLPKRLSLPADNLVVSYMTRTGRVDLDRLSTTAPRVVREALTSYAGEVLADCGDVDLAEWVLGRPFSRGRVRTRRRLVAREELEGVSVTRVRLDPSGAWTTEADDLLAELVGHDLAIEVVWLEGPNAAGAFAARVDFAERVRWAYPRASVLVEAPESERATLAAALVAGRLDLAVLSPGADVGTPTATAPAAAGRPRWPAGPR
jgi:anthraniloyl-CoA monooxygenase